jgi:hypothetical protein
VKPFERLHILTTLILLTSLSAVGQTLPDSIVITKNTYVHNFTGGENLYGTINYSIIRENQNYFLNNKKIAKSKIFILLREVTKQNNTDNSLAKYEIDTNWVKNNPSDLLRLYSDKKIIEWNQQQKEFVFKVLTNLSNYKEELDDYLLDGSNYGMHSSYKNEFIIRFYNNQKILNEIKSRKYVWGYKMPWVNLSGDTLYNYNIETNLKDIISSEEKTKKPLKGTRLQKYLVNKIIDSYMPSLYLLSAYSYQNEIDELKTDFKVVSSEEVYGRGRYIWNDPKTMKIVLKNQLMFDNVNLIFFASKFGKTIYSRDSIKQDYRKYINRIQSIKFIADYLKSNSNSRLGIYYFNNNGINEYNIDAVNKNPKEWIKYDKWVEGLKWDSAHNIKLSFDVNKSIKVSKQVNCGCNYRFDKSYIEKAIFFEINDNNKNSSVWFLLPDNKVLLYLMQGDKVLNYSYKDFGDFQGVQYPCKLFNTNGQMIPK